MAFARKHQDEASALSKRRDDNSTIPLAQPLQPWRAWRPRRKRIVVTIAVLALLVVFFRHLPTDVPSISQRIDPRYGPLGRERLLPLAALTAKTTASTPTSQDQHAFDGPIKFYSLASSLAMQAHEDQHTCSCGAYQWFCPSCSGCLR